MPRDATEFFAAFLLLAVEVNLWLSLHLGFLFAFEAPIIILQDFLPPSKKYRGRDEEKTLLGEGERREERKGEGRERERHEADKGTT